MKPCQHYSKKLIFFDELDQEEQKEIDQHLKSCEDCRIQFEQFQLIEFGLYEFENMTHVDDDLLVRYSVHLAEPGTSDYDGRKLTSSEIRLIQNHTTKCATCHEKLNHLIQEYQEIKIYFENSDLPDISIKPATLVDIALVSIKNITEAVTNTVERLKKKTFVPIPRFYPVAVGAMAALFAVIWFGPFYRSNNPYWQLTNLQEQSVASVTRSSLPQGLNAGLTAFQRGDYENTIEIFETFISNFPTHPSLFYVDYILGVSYLIEAKTDLWGRFQTVDRIQVEKAIQNLQNAHNASTNLGVREDCDWYLAKAYLLLEKGEKAQEKLNQIISLRGRRFQEAQKMVKELNTLKSK